MYYFYFENICSQVSIYIRVFVYVRMYVSIHISIHEERNVRHTPGIFTDMSDFGMLTLLVIPFNVDKPMEILKIVL